MKRIDHSRQAYERVPVDQSAAYLVATAETSRAKVTFNGSANRILPGIHDNEGMEPSGRPETEAAAREWCSARYRSYNASDNTYQPYGVSGRRACNAPVATAPTSSQDLARAGVAIEIDANARWCMARYSSYRIEDNTYQPFSGGRKRCVGPGSESASNIRPMAQYATTQF